LTNWSLFPGPKYYRPDDVEPALAGLAAVSSEHTAREAYNTVLFAIGNNHAGTLYPAVVGAVPRILTLATKGQGWVRRAAMNILVDVLTFEIEPGFERFTMEDDVRTDTKLALRRLLRAEEQFFLSVIADVEAPEPFRIDALDLLDALDCSAEKLAALLLLMPERTAQGRFDGRRKRFLIDHGHR
jgi:hypothetical protein